MTSSPYAPGPVAPSHGLALTRQPPVPENEVPLILGLSLTFAFIAMLLGWKGTSHPPRYDDGHTDPPLLYAALLGFGVIALVVGVWFAWRAHGKRSEALRHHSALVGRLATTWARVIRSDVVGSVSSDGTLTHHVLSLELEGAWDIHAGYREGGGLRWEVTWPTAATLSGYVVSGIWIGVAYDTAAPHQARTVVPQCIVTTSGATLPFA